MNKIIQGDARTVLRTFNNGKFQCCVTSPPYWGLRDYGVEPMVWSDNGCEHEWRDNTYIRNTDITAGEKQRTNIGSIGRDVPVQNAYCTKCSAWRGSLGLEPHPQMYIDHLVEIFTEVMRVIRKDGVCFVNLGDTYYGSQGHQDAKNPSGRDGRLVPQDRKENWLQPKQKLLIPHRFAIAMQDAGYIVRNDLIWAKPNHMPSSVRDRFTASYEHIFMIVKSRKYYFDLDAVREEHSEVSLERVKYGWHGNLCDGHAMGGIKDSDVMGTCHPNGKNPGDVWRITTKPYPKAHFATFPPELPKRCILCSTKEGDAVLDPFAGSGTTLQMAYRLGRKYMGIELQDEYMPLINDRISQQEIFFD